MTTPHNYVDQVQIHDETGYRLLESYFSTLNDMYMSRIKNAHQRSALIRWNIKSYNGFFIWRGDLNKESAVT